MNDRALGRILYVDDEPDIRRVAQIALERVGEFTVHICSSGQEALDEVEAFQPDLILLDVMMPGMDGPTTLSKLRGMTNWCDVPVIFLTAKTQAAEIDRFMELGAVSVITKPFQPLTLPTRLRALWTDRVLHGEQWRFQKKEKPTP